MYVPYWLYDLIRSFWPIVITAIATLVVSNVPKYVWRLVWRLYSKWREKWRERKSNEELERSLSARELTVFGGRFVGKRLPGPQIGPFPFAETLPPRKGKVCSSRANRGKYGPWDRTARGPNVLLRKARESLHLTLASAAEKLDVEDLELSRWERGKCLPTRKMLARLCEGYGMSAEQLGYDELEKSYLKKSRRGQDWGASKDDREGSKPGKDSNPLASERKRNE